MENKYRGECGGCRRSVEAREGIYENGYVLCSEKPWDDNDSVRRAFGDYFDYDPECRGASVPCGYLWERFIAVYNSPEACEAREASEALKEVEQSAKLAEMVGGGLAELARDARVRSLSAVIVKMCGEGVTLDVLTLEQVNIVASELRSRITTREAKEAREATRARLGYLPCKRCGGDGAYWKMAANGKYFDDGCFRCYGSGREPERPRK
jgi:hypothetical protein